MAETYLLRAKAYFWKGDLQSAANDINEVRTRAGCAPITAKTAENGKTYSIENFSDNNYFCDRIIAKNNFYLEGNSTNHGDKYIISPYHVFWPVPTVFIQGSTYGHINQNKGYADTKLR